MPPPTFSGTADDLLPILAELAPREPIFHRAAFYATLADFDRLMAPSYWEVGASGRRYSRAFILGHLAANTPVEADSASWSTSDFGCQRLGPETYLLTYTFAQPLSAQPARLTRRATIWQRTASGWQILYHQGTLMTGAPDDTDPGPIGYHSRPEARSHANSGETYE